MAFVCFASGSVFVFVWREPCHNMVEWGFEVSVNCSFFNLHKCGSLCFWEYCSQFEEVQLKIPIFGLKGLGGNSIALFSRLFSAKLSSKKNFIEFFCVYPVIICIHLDARQVINRWRICACLQTDCKNNLEKNRIAPFTKKCDGQTQRIPTSF